MSQHLCLGLVLSSVLLAASAARAQEMVIAEEQIPPWNGETPPVSTSPPDQAVAPDQTPGEQRPEGKPIVAIARLQDELDPALTQESLAALDETLWTTISGRAQTRYDIVRLKPTGAPCDATCAVVEARALGARFVVWSAVGRSQSGLYVNTAIVQVEDGRTLRMTRSSFLTNPELLPAGARQAASETANILFPAAHYDPGARRAPAPRRNDSWGSMSPEQFGAAYEEFREQNVQSPDYGHYKSKRDGGIGLFVLGIVMDSLGGGLIGAGLSNGSTGLVVAGGISEGLGVIFFFGGLGGWITNQIRMNKIERGIPLSRGLRLEGLSPMVASREGAAPGLSAEFEF